MSGLLASFKRHVSVELTGFPPKEERPSQLFRDLGYSDGDIAVGYLHKAIPLDDIDEKLRLMKGTPLQIRRLGDGPVIIRYERVDREVDAIFMQEDGLEYRIILLPGGDTNNPSINEVRQGSVRRRAFPGIPQSDN